MRGRTGEKEYQTPSRRHGPRARKGPVALRVKGRATQGGGRRRRGTPKVEKGTDPLEGLADLDQDEEDRHQGEDLVEMEMEDRMEMEVRTEMVVRTTTESPKTPGEPHRVTLGCRECREVTEMEAAGAAETVTEGTGMDNSSRTPTVTQTAMSMPRCLRKWFKANSR